jgi:hypothetical protein
MRELGFTFSWDIVLNKDATACLKTDLNGLLAMTFDDHDHQTHYYFEVVAVTTKMHFRETISRKRPQSYVSFGQSILALTASGVHLDLVWGRDNSHVTQKEAKACRCGGGACTDSG